MTGGKRLEYWLATLEAPETAILLPLYTTPGMGALARFGAAPTVLLLFVYCIDSIPAGHSVPMPWPRSTCVSLG